MSKAARRACPSAAESARQPRVRYKDAVRPFQYPRSRVLWPLIGDHPLWVTFVFSTVPFQARCVSSLLLCHLCPVSVTFPCLPQSGARLSVMKHP